ncbi:hypothetical protein ACFL2B_00220 [Patescibacteria group bacterium]
MIVWAGYSGIPIEKQQEDSGCIAKYKEYIFPRFICQYVSSSHCRTSEFNRGNAEKEIARCLCDKYSQNPISALEQNILSKCKTSDECLEIVDVLKDNECNHLERDSLECDAYIEEKYLREVNFICEYKDEIFTKVYIH